jgi:hypothetical protein
MGFMIAPLSDIFLSCWAFSVVYTKKFPLKQFIFIFWIFKKNLKNFFKWNFLKYIYIYIYIYKIIFKKIYYTNLWTLQQFVIHTQHNKPTNHVWWYITFHPLTSAITPHHGMSLMCIGPHPPSHWTALHLGWMQMWKLDDKIVPMRGT